MHPLPLHQKYSYIIILFIVHQVVATANPLTSLQTIFSLSDYKDQLPCAQNCFLSPYSNNYGCITDAIASVLGCACNNCRGLDSEFGATNDCYCRTDLQPIGLSYLTKCVSSGCTLGDPTNDIQRAGSIYYNYCSSIGLPINLDTVPTQNTSPQATQTVYVTVYVASSAVHSRRPAMVWALVLLFLVHPESPIHSNFRSRAPISNNVCLLII